MIPLMSLWQEKSHTRSHRRPTDVTLALRHGITVSLTVMVGPTQNPSNHQARQWQDLSRAESILGPTLIESRVHTLSSISLSILTPERQSDRWKSLELDTPSVSEK